MGLAEFEEKEFEKPLYNQLENGRCDVWTPGQCFEYYFGIDYAGNINLDSFWKRFGFLPKGVILQDYNFDYIWKAKNKKRKLPDFRLNLFIQAKRPFYHIRLNKDSIFQNKYYSFDINSRQQKILEKLAKVLGNDALIVYAAPAFSTFDDLYLHTRKGDIVEYTSFPEVIKLSGHESWNYQNVKNGKACSEPELIYTKGIFRLISNYVEENDHYYNNRNNFDDDFDIYQNLERLEGKIVDTLRQNFIEDVQVNFFLEKIEEIHEFYGHVYRSYAVIKVFCEIFNLDWFVLQ